MKSLSKILEDRIKEHQRSLVEPLWYLRSIPYLSYLGSHHWKKRSELFRSTAEHSCDLCGIDDVRDDQGNCLDWLPKFHVHHVSYKNLGCELDQDLRLLCSACHNLVHFPDSNAARFWIDYHSHDPLLKSKAMALAPAEQAYSKPDWVANKQEVRL